MLASETEVARAVEFLTDRAASVTASNLENGVIRDAGAKEDIANYNHAISLIEALWRNAQRPRRLPGSADMTQAPAND